jgi:hypothetical protein
MLLWIGSGIRWETRMQFAGSQEALIPPLPLRSWHEPLVIG